MRLSVPSPTLLTPLLFLLVCSTVNAAGFFDNIINKAKQTAEEIVNDSINENVEDKPAEKPQPAQQSVPTPQSSPVYDPTLVKQIQQSLNQLGYSVGAADGLYGTGTSKAIEAFQKNQGITVDGKPSEVLLAELKVAQKTHSPPQKATAATGLPEPTPGAFMLAAIHFWPQWLDNESMLKRVLLTVHPDQKSIVSNEFQWHKRKDELKSQLLTEAKAAQLSFELQPWRDSSISKSLPLELVKYYFERQAFLVKFAVGTARQVTPNMLISSSGTPAPKYLQQFNWLSIDSDKAEQIANYFGNKMRKVYLHYRLNAVGAPVNASQPTPLVEFENDQLDMYALESTPQGNKIHTEFKYLTTVMIPTTDKPAPMPVAQKPVESQTNNSSGIIPNVVIDGVKLGMPIEKALNQLIEHGYKMEQPSQPSQLTGVTIKGRGAAEGGVGGVKVMIRHMNGIVYQFDKDIIYMLNKLPEGTSVPSLLKKYQAEFKQKFTGVSYEYTAPTGVIHFDDTSPPPYNRKITSPHARIIVN